MIVAGADTWVRASAETMPMVTVWPTPKGSPIASTRSPTCTASELAKGTTGRFLALGVDLQHREIGARIGQQHLGPEFALVRQGHGDLVAAFHHMVVGDDQAVGAHDHAGAQALLHALAHFRRAEQLAEQRIAEEGVDLGLHHRLGIDIDHGGRDALDHRREGSCTCPIEAGAAAARGGGGARAMARPCCPAQRRQRHMQGPPGHGARGHEIVFIRSSRLVLRRLHAQMKKGGIAAAPNLLPNPAKIRLRPRLRLPPDRNPGPWRFRRGPRTR